MRGQRQQGAGVAFADSAIDKRLLNRVGQFEQAQGVGDRHAAFANPLGNLLVRQAKLVRELAVGMGFFQCVQISALDVFDQGQFQFLLVASLTHNHGHFGQPGQLRGLPAAFTSNQNVALAPSLLLTNSG